MHSLRASIIFVAITVFAFLADNRRIHSPATPPPGEYDPAPVALETQAPEPSKIEVAAEKTKPSKKKKTKVTRVVRATAYNADPLQTDDTPEICAWGDKVRPGIIAISRDLEKSGLTRGKEVHVEGIGKVVVMDRMHHRKRNQIDLFMESHEDALEFGVQELTISWTEDPHTEQES
jgi:3D (Asp-Asp-Asp) domain-containing protein